MVQTKDLGATVGEHGANKGLRATVGEQSSLRAQNTFVINPMSRERKVGSPEAVLRILFKRERGV